MDAGSSSATPSCWLASTEPWPSVFRLRGRASACLTLAYGFVFAFAGYGAWVVAQYVSPWGPVVLAAGIFSGALAGIIVCALAFIPIHDKPNFTIRGLIATLAINLIGTQGLLWWFGPRSKSLPEIFGTWKISLPVLF